MRKTAHVDLDNARHDDQRDIMKTIIEADESPFLLENLRKYHQKEILREGKNWYVTYNQWPYNNTKLHFLIIHQEYVTSIDQITPEAAQELLDHAAWLTKKFNVPGGAFCMRFGDTNYSAGTVDHLHAQYIVPDLNAEEYKPTRFKIGKNKEDVEK
jgi:diadenosine tetraphosphate (Ap4A) HIT family hydrolase